MKIKLTHILFCLCTVLSIKAQTLPVPRDIGNIHPRVFGRDMAVENVRKLTEKEEWARQIIEKKEKRLKKYLERYGQDTTWLVSRLQMYWNTRATQVYINGGTYSHAEGEAPVPTVRFPGTRDHSTGYIRPKLEDIKPYMDDPGGLYLQHKAGKDQWEWTAPQNTGRMVESINREIMEVARDAAFLFWYTGDKAYARLAFGVFDTYIQGIYHLKEPLDLSHGHHQTLVGYTSFEVIQEHILTEITQCYDFLYGYIQTNYPDRVNIYTEAFQKWADQQIKNGVSFNNWNLLQAFHISKIALVLENDDHYENGKGAQYYLDQIMNRNSVRQWSMAKLIGYGYDPDTGIWNESPGYSFNVLHDFIRFAKFYDRSFDIDLVGEIPVLDNAVRSAVQYLYPNGYTVAFGDGHYGKLSPEAVLYMIENARKYGKKESEAYFTWMLKTLFDRNVYEGEFIGRLLQDLFAGEPLQVSKDITAGRLSNFTSPLFHAPNTSWLVQRQGEGDTGLMISQIGSKGNHMHSNGIAMELYGYGLPLAPEMGHGSSYFSTEYAEYYTQFPAHNTVIVNGKSKYPEMKSNHGFKVMSAYPRSGEKEGNVPGITFSDVTFLEPETNSAQRRVMGIVKNRKTDGYYIDIFRSQQNEGNDIKHEYFYHNLGQSLILTDTKGDQLDLQPTDKLAFGDGDLMAYDYMWDKRSALHDKDFRGEFRLKMKAGTVSMKLWMKGAEGREIFSVLSPKSTAFRHGPLLDDLAELPVPTLVVKQEGEAWTRPFAAIYEPVLNGESHISEVGYFGEGENTGVRVDHRSGERDFIFSSTQPNKSFRHKDMEVWGTYAIVSQKGESDFRLFLGNGKEIRLKEYCMKLSDDTGMATLAREKGQWYLACDHNAVLRIPDTYFGKEIVLKAGDHKIKGSRKKIDGKPVVIFEIPAMKYTRFDLVSER